MTDAALAVPNFQHPPPAAQRTALHSGIGVETFLSLQLLAAAFPLAAGFLLFGWRAAGTAAAVIFSTLGGGLILQRIGWRGRQLRVGHLMWLAMILTLMLPPHLFTTEPVQGQIAWPILPAAGIVLAILCWLLGGLGSQRVQPAVVTLLILFVQFHSLLTPLHVLRRDHVFTGDILKANPREKMPTQTPWFVPTPPTGYEASTMEPAGDKLLAYTSNQARPDRSSITLQMLIRDQMPPLEDLILGGQCAPIGQGSAIAIIVGGLFLLYRGLIDFRIPLLGVISAMAALLILPDPVYITNTTTAWHWMVFRAHYVGWATALTFANYELLASPLLLTLFFLANTSGLRPITRRGRSVFAILLGVLSAVLILYASSAIGPYVALLVVSLLTPTLDRVMHPHTLV